MAGIVVAFKQYNARKGMFGSDWVALAISSFCSKPTTPG